MIKSSCSCSRSCSRFCSCSVCGGALQGHAGENGFNMAGYGLEYIGIARVKGNYQKMYHKGWEEKARIYSFKSIMNILTP